MATINYASTEALTALVNKVKALLTGKVDVREGWALSQNDLTDALKQNYDAAHTFATSHAACENDAEKNKIQGITVNGVTVTPDPSTRIAAIKMFTKVSELENDSNFQKDTDVANTLKAYTNTVDMNKAIAAAVADAGHLTYQKLGDEEQLPSQGKENVIYLKKSATQGAQNVYDEYMWIGAAWEIIGSTYVNMENYYKKSETMSSEQINSAISTALADYTTTVEMNNKFALYYTKVDIDGKVDTINAAIAERVKTSDMVEITGSAVEALFG